MLLFRFSLRERFILMDLLLFLNLRRIRRWIRESSLFRTFPGSSGQLSYSKESRSLKGCRYHTSIEPYWIQLFKCLVERNHIDTMLVLSHSSIKLIWISSCLRIMGHLPNPIKPLCNYFSLFSAARRIFRVSKSY